MNMKQDNSISDRIQQTKEFVRQPERTQRTTHPSLSTQSLQFDQHATVTSMQRQIDRLKRALGQKEHEVWTLKQLLLYR